MVWRPSYIYIMLFHMFYFDVTFTFHFWRLLSDWKLRKMVSIYSLLCKHMDSPITGRIAVAVGSETQSFRIADRTGA